MKFLRNRHARKQLEFVAETFKAHEANAKTTFELWHEPKTRNAIQRRIIEIGFGKIGKSPLRELILNFEENVERDGFKSVDEFVKNNPKFKKEELISQLEKAKQRINNFIRDIQMYQIPQNKKEHFAQTKTGINNLSMGLVNYLDLIIDHLKKQK